MKNTHREDTPAPQLNDAARTSNQDDFPTDFFVCDHCGRSMEKAFSVYDSAGNACCAEGCALDNDADRL